MDRVLQKKQQKTQYSYCSPRGTTDSWIYKNDSVCDNTFSQQENYSNIIFRLTERKFEKVFLENTYFLVTNVCQKLIKKTALKYNNEGEISWAKTLTVTPLSSSVQDIILNGNALIDTLKTAA